MRRAHEARRVRHGGGEQGDESFVGVPDARPRDPIDGAGHEIPALPHGHARAARTDFLDELDGPGIGGGGGAEGGLRQFARLRGELVVAFREDPEGDAHPHRL